LLSRVLTVRLTARPTGKTKSPVTLQGHSTY
jgi:hypothetical protein